VKIPIAKKALAAKPKHHKQDENEVPMKKDKLSEVMQSALR